jgi:mRNA interferase HigB
MRIISFRRLREFYEVHHDSKTSLEAWAVAVENADWKTFADVRKTFRSADIYGDCTIFDIGGNKYRLIAWVNYKTHAVYVRNILTHSDYDKGKWKADCGSG